MKKKFYYAVILIVLFLIVFTVLILYPKVGEERDERVFSLMSEATLPLVYPCYDELKINPLHGYVDDMDAMSMRDTLTPLQDDRHLELCIDTYGTEISGITYEIRTLDMERILEKTTIKEWKTESEVVTAVLPIENLLTEGEEYQLRISLKLGDGREVFYYTRIILGLDNVNEKFSYVMDFNIKTFDKKAALDLVPYLESGSKGDNTNYGYVNIYSSFQQITWGNLDIELISDISISLKETNGNISYFQVEYYVNSKNMYNTEETYKVKEFYRTRYTNTRTYLLSFERTMEQYFEPVSENIYASRINLGITENVNADSVEAVECPSGNRVCFVRNGELWQYSSDENTFTKVFTFVEENDIRTLYGQHDIKIAKVDDSGNVIFMVYGYMNRGIHEGQVGVSVYSYTQDDKAVEELVYIPYNKQYAHLAESVGKVCYVNSSNWLFFVFDEKLYSLDLASRECVVILDGLKERNYIVNSVGDTIVWQVGENDLAGEIKTLNLDTSKEKNITCGREEVIRLIGYMDGDIVYGVTKKDDIVVDVLGAYTCYMYKLCIIDEDNSLVGSYKKDNVYIEDADISDGMIILNRFEKDEEGQFNSIVVDYLTLNVSEKKEPLSTDVVVTELKKKEIWMNISGIRGEGKLGTEETNSVYYEGNKKVLLSSDADKTNKYFVYSKAEFCKSFDNIADAIEHANAELGIVTDYEGRYIWKRGNSYNSRNLSNIVMAVDEVNTLSACVDAMLQKVGVTIASKVLLEKGYTVADIFEDVEEYECLYLNGVALEQILYFINDGKTVIGKSGESEFVLITGYDVSTITVYSAITGKPTKMKIDTASKLFMENGNFFISYLEQ